MMKANGKIKKAKKIKQLWFVLYIFAVVFCPPILPRFDLILIAISAVLLFWKYRGKSIEIMQKSGMLFWVGALIVLACYTIAIPLLMSAFVYNDIVQLSNYTSACNRLGLLTLSLLICGSYLILELKRNGFGVEDFLKFTFWAGAVESAFSIMALLFPQVKRTLLMIMYLNTGNELYANTWYVTTRAYGFASTMVDLFGLGVSIIASVCFVYGIFKNKKYVLLSIFLIIPAVLNARTGLVLYGVCVIAVLLFLAVRGNLKKLIVGLIVATIAVSGFQFLLNSDLLDDSTKGWITSGLDSFFSLFETGEATSDSMGVLFQDAWWELPEGIRVIIGTGHSRYQADGYAHTDVGYVNEIWMFGVIGAIFLYCVIIKIIYRNVFNYNNNMALCISMVLLCQYFAFNVKGMVLSCTPGAMAMFLIAFVLGFFLRDERKNKCVK